MEYVEALEKGKGVSSSLSGSWEMVLVDGNLNFSKVCDPLTLQLLVSYSANSEAKEKEKAVSLNLSESNEMGSICLNRL